MRKRNTLIKTYLLTFVCFSVYFLIKTEDFVGYYSRHGTIDISGWDFVLSCTIHYIIPVIVLFFGKSRNIDIKSEVFVSQYKVITISMLLMAIATFSLYEEGEVYYLNIIITGTSYILRLYSYYLMLKLVFKKDSTNKGKQK